MAPRRNELVTNWLAAYCGDERFLFRLAISTIKQRRSLETENGWPMIDSESESYRLLLLQLPKRIENLAPTPVVATVATTIEAGGLRATLETVSNYQFLLRGFLVDLANENAFGERVLNYLRNFGTIAAATDVGNSSRQREESDYEFQFTPSYAGTATVNASTFVGEVNFSDFASFEMHGMVLNQKQPQWDENFNVELENFLKMLSPK